MLNRFALPTPGRAPGPGGSWRSPGAGPASQMNNNNNNNNDNNTNNVNNSNNTMFIISKSLLVAYTIDVRIPS